MMISDFYAFFKVETTKYIVCIKPINLIGGYNFKIPMQFNPINIGGYNLIHVHWDLHRKIHGLSAYMTSLRPTNLKMMMVTGNIPKPPYPVAN